MSKILTFITVVFIFTFINTPVIAGAEQYYFEKFPFNEKLPSNSVIRTYHDKEGFIWFGTKDGLCRFDGYDLKVFRSSALTPGKLNNNEIQCIVEDNNNKLWVGTLEGINIIDKKNFKTLTLDNKYVNSERINSILSDKEGNIWIATSSYGVLKMNPETFEYERYSYDSDSPVKLNGNNITHIYEDKSGRIWLSSWKTGLCQLDWKNKKVYYAPEIGYNNNPFRFFEDKEGLFWVCTWGDGIFNLTLNNNSEMTLSRMKLSKKSNIKTDDIVYSITQDDKDGLIWVVTFSNLSVIKKENDGTFTVTNSDAYFSDSSNKLFHEIVKDRWGNLWLGSIGDGLLKLDFNKLTIQNFTISEIKKTLNIPPYVTHFCENGTGEVFLTINRIGLFSFDPSSGFIRRIINQDALKYNSVSALLHVKTADQIWLANEGEDVVHIFKSNKSNDLEKVKSIRLSEENSGQENSIINMFEDSKGNVWIGTNNGIYQKPSNAPVRLISSKFQFVTSITEDSEHNIWIGTGKQGVFLCKTEVVNKQKSYLFYSVPLIVDKYRSLSVQSICCSNKGEIYIGTREGCLFLYNKQTGTFSDLSGQFGITEEGIMDIIADNHGALWISTIKNIIRYNPDNQSASYFTEADGMLVSSFFKDASIVLKSGMVMFGGNKGVCAFNSSDYQITQQKNALQTVTITDILIQNKSIYDYNRKSHFDEKAHKVVLDYTENNLSLEFSALNYPSANKIQYAYKMSGVDRDWNYVANNRRFVNYANLASGHYTFEVKATNENGTWSDKVTTMSIDIRPPWYRSFWAYVFYIITTGAIIFFITRTFYNRIRLRNELKISHIEKEKTEELAQIKLRYFTNISHELLTPLTIIMLQIERMQKKNTEFAPQFEIMKDNVIRLKRLIKQILVFRKTESGNMKLKVVRDDIVLFVKNICHSGFKPQVSDNEVDFTFDVEYDSYMAWFDPDKLDKIIYNLLSNAFKFTPKGGSIAVKMSFVPRRDQVCMRLSVSDTGSGISDEDLPNIFKRFYISRSSDQSKSHGIGLSLTSDLLQIHKGSIEVKSQLGEGSVFTMEIPVSPESYTDDEKSVDEENPVDAEESDNKQEVLTVLDENSGDAAMKLSILIVEDNQDLKNLIAENFAEKYTVYTAENGIQALQIVHEKEIDIVISDVMMPEMDGLTLCKIIKNDILTSHINVLMLTAKNSVEDRIECYNAGSDAFISKPFELTLLDARVRNLISKRIQKTESFRRNQEINISSMEYCSIDEVFLKQAILKVEQKLSDETFDFDKFAIDMATSKSTLHRKLKSLTGLSPGEFIRNVRLKHAVQMLSNNMGNISEIAFGVGFNDPKYFSRCFKTEYGMTPKEFQESLKKKKE